jgi:hypothetical protein
LLIAMASAGEVLAQPAKDAGWARVAEDDRAIKVETEKLEAVIPKKEPKQWMTGIEKGSFLDTSTGFREVGDGLMVVDWLMEPGSDAAGRAQNLRHAADVPSVVDLGVMSSSRVGALRRRSGWPFRS